MNCNNCQLEMEIVTSLERIEARYRIFWCSYCGTSYDEEQDEWLIPNSVENTKKLVAALIKANDRASNHVGRLNRMIDDQRDELGYADRDR